MQFAGGAARVFTTLQELNDPTSLVASVTSFTLNTIIMLLVRVGA